MITTRRIGHIILIQNKNNETVALYNIYKKEYVGNELYKGAIDYDKQCATDEYYNTWLRLNNNL